VAGESDCGKSVDPATLMVRFTPEIRPSAATVEETERETWTP
jgi:hypothetical protein